MNAGFLMMNGRTEAWYVFGGYVRENWRLVNRVWRGWGEWGTFVGEDGFACLRRVLPCAGIWNPYRVL